MVITLNVDGLRNSAKRTDEINVTDINSRSNISNTRKSVSSNIQTLRSGLKKRGAAEFF